MYYQKRGIETRNRIVRLVELRRGSWTIREIATELHLSTATVHRQLRILSDQGRLTYTPGLARTIRLNEEVS